MIARESEDDYQPSLVEGKSAQFIVLSGCSGGGKSSLLTELALRGYQVFGEPGRQIVKEQLHIGGTALPWADVDKFMDLVLSRAIHQMIVAAQNDRLSFFDRGIVDTFGFFDRQASPTPKHILTCVKKYRYNNKVFLVPPWPEIYRTDVERRHTFEDAVLEYDSLLETYQRLGYEVAILPKAGVTSRADFVLTALGR